MQHFIHGRQLPEQLRLVCAFHQTILVHGLITTDDGCRPEKRGKKLAHMGTSVLKAFTIQPPRAINSKENPSFRLIYCEFNLQQDFKILWPNYPSLVLFSEHLFSP